MDLCGWLLCVFQYKTSEEFETSMEHKQVCNLTTHVYASSGFTYKP